MKKLAKKKEDISTVLKILDQVEDLSELITECVVRKKVGIRGLFKAVRMIDDIVDCAKELDQFIPEMKDLDKDEAAVIGSRMLTIVRGVQDIILEHRKEGE
tara:strand:+ start:17900 stop:18202 length:303 start_codon:yes stop_codon:yes gene_type:complete